MVRMATALNGRYLLQLREIGATIKQLMLECAVRPHLMKLLAHDYVLLQELPRTVDHNPRTTTYLWHVDIDQAYRTLERDMFRTMGTLFGRMAHEQRVNAPALAALTPQVEGGASLEHLSEAQQAEARVAQRKIDCLENALLQVHHTAMKMRAIA